MKSRSKVHLSKSLTDKTRKDRSAQSSQLPTWELLLRTHNIDSSIFVLSEEAFGKLDVGGVEKLLFKHRSDRWLR